MSYDCKNPAPASTCGDYAKQYIGNMDWIANKLLEIIRTNILSSEYGPNDITGTNCACKNICEEEGTFTTCIELAPATVFNCVTWESIKKVLIDSSSSPDGNPGYIPLLCQTIKCFLEKTAKVNYGFAAQMERFLCLAESLNTRLDSVCCNNKCPELVGDLLCLLMQILTKLMSAVNKAATLMYYNDCDINAINGNRVVQSFFECMACDFVNDLCELEKLIGEVSALVVGFATCDMQKCTPCYTAPSVPRKVRPMCPSNTMTYGGGYSSGNPYQSQGGCGCKK